MYYCMKTHRMRIFVSLFISGLLVTSVNAQTIIKREHSAVPINENIHIDGVLNEASWNQAPIADNFTQFQFKYNMASAYKTEVRVLYDNTAIYIGATMYDPAPDSIQVGMTQRDEFATADFFGIILDPYLDGNNALEFFVSAAGVQGDAKAYAGAGNFGEDFNWDAVWASDVKISEIGWVAEMRIPYSAIRFPNVDVQTWGVNYIREVKRNRDKSSWNNFDPQIDGFVKQCGLLKGIEHIEPPIRLSISPYFSSYYDLYSDKINDISSTAWSFNGGADLKYGLNDAFTLDMTLIPDFGQVQSDNQVLNLTPFETYYVEQRQFFTEGTELFNKGDLFYTRRIGGTPYGYYDVYYGLDTTESVIDNPIQAHLLNAAKVSGRTSKGLGIGVFNAVEGETYAAIENSEGEKRTELTGPRANYNVLVFDQQLKNNSYVSLINTNTLRDGNYQDANVTGMEFLVNNKSNIWGVEGGAAYSSIFDADAEPTTGIHHRIRGGKTGGKRRFILGYDYIGSTYNINDLGYLPINNQLNFSFNTSYNSYEPLWHLNQIHMVFETNYLRLVDPEAFQNFSIYGETYGSFRNYMYAGVFFYTEPVTTYDYFEPRVPGRFYTYPVNYNFGGWLSTDYGKRWAIDINSNYRVFDDEGRYRWNVSMSPRWRATDRILIILDAGRYYWPGDVGFVNLMGDSIIMGRRKNVTMEGVLSVNYAPLVSMNFNMRLRHYWSFAEYSDFYNLGENGDLLATTYNSFLPDGTSSDDVNFNAFNVDLVYTWYFAPGSELNVVWKNAIYQFGTLLPENYVDDLNQVFDSPTNNNFSIKVLYYLDYLYLQKRKA